MYLSSICMSLKTVAISQFLGNPYMCQATWSLFKIFRRAQSFGNCARYMVSHGNHAPWLLHLSLAPKAIYNQAPGPGTLRPHCKGTCMFRHTSPLDTVPSRAVFIRKQGRHFVNLSPPQLTASQEAGHNFNHYTQRFRTAFEASMLKFLKGLAA